jgi:hypothetical protein
MCLSEAKASHSQRMIAEVPSSTPHPYIVGKVSSQGVTSNKEASSHPGLSPVKGQHLTLVSRPGPEINSRACLWVLPGSCPPPKVPGRRALLQVPNEGPIE